MKGAERPELARVHEALRESERRYRGLVESQADVVVRADFQGRLTFVNDAMCRAIGLPREEILGRDFFHLVHEDDRPPVMAALATLLAPPHRNHLMIRCLTSAGWRWFEWEGCAIRDEQGRVVEIQTVGRDVTEHRQADQMLAERERLAALGRDVGLALTERDALHAVLQRCTEALVCHLDAAFARIWTLKESEQVLELQASAGMYTHTDGGHSRVPVGKFKIGLIAQERAPHLTNSVLGDPRVHDQEWARREGMVAFAGYPLVLDDQDQLIGVMAMFARRPLPEVTLTALASVARMIALGIERRRAEDALRESAARYRGLIESQQDLIVRCDPEYRLTFVNDAYQRRFGVRVEEALGSSWVPLVHPDDLPQLREAEELMRRPPYRQTFQNRARTPDGWRWFEWEVCAIHDAHGVLAELQASGRDITDRRQMEHDLRRAERLASIGTLAAGIAHEINNPAAAILMNAQLALASHAEPAGAATVQSCLQTIVAEAKRCGRIVKGVLQFAKEETSERWRENVNELVERAVDLMHHEIERRDATAALALTPELPPVLANATQIEQLLVNLIRNALEAGGKGMRIMIRTAELAGMVRVSVEDNGPGIPETLRSRIFDPFFTTRQEAGGVGLGLSICHGIVLAHGGSISAAETADGGAAIVVDLPCVSGTDLAPAASSQRR